MERVWKIDVPDREFGYSFAVKGDIDNMADALHLAENYDLFEESGDIEYATAEDITEDKHTLNAFKNCIVEVHNQVMKYNVIRDGYGFRETFDAGIDYDSCQCDIEGVDIYNAETEEFIGHIDWILPIDIEVMDDKEFYEFLADNGIS